DSAITVEAIINVLQGRGNGSHQFIFDNANSSTVRFLMELAGIKQLPQKGVYALSSNAEVIKHIYNNPGAIGVIGVNWIEQPDKDLEQYVSSIKTLAVKNLPGKPGSDGFYRPSQSSLALET